MGRIRQIDCLRGFFLIVMTIDHVSESASDYVFQFFGFVTAAEGFVFLSGVVAAIVYSRYLDDWPALKTKAFVRALVIYVYHFLVCFIYFAVKFGQARWIQGDASGAMLHLQHFGTSMLLLYQTTLLDILPMYFVFLLLLPYMLVGFTKRALLALGISGVAWLCAQFLTFDDATYARIGMRFGEFNILAWQLIFFAGAYGGFRYQRYSKSDAKRDYWIRLPTWIWLLLATIALAFFLQRHFEMIPRATLARALDRGTLPPLRLLNFAAVVLVTYFVFSRLPRLHSNALAFLGQHSLQVFAFSILLTFFWALIKRSIHARFGLMGEYVYLVLSLCSLFLPAWLHQRYQRYHHGKAQPPPKTVQKTPSTALS